MNNVDRQYLGLLKEIVSSGTRKETRCGPVLSLFGRSMRFNLKEGFPLLTTKKVFVKGIIHELLWFLNHPYNSHGSMNIEYLVRNGVHIWDDDAYRWFKETVAERFTEDGGHKFMVCLDNDDSPVSKGRKPSYEYWIENDYRRGDSEWLRNMSKEDFIDLTLQRVEIWGPFMERYRFGDLGPIYGTQWRSFGHDGIDQIRNIIDTLKTNPNDRRMLCVAWNPDVIGEMALPPCHVMAQFYTRELSNDERLKIFNERYVNGEIPDEWHEWFAEYSKGTEEGMDVPMPADGSGYDMAGIPKYGLSCMFTMRSNDYMCGTSFNIAQYALLTHMIANVVGMVPDELVYSVGDCHVYMNHMDGVNEQLSRNGSDTLPRLVIHGKHSCVEDFRYDDFEVVGYNPDPPIRFELNVGLGNA